jgi:riboflavin synthase alpha subunit
LRARRVGDKVNIETDLIGKYVQQLLHLKPCHSPAAKRS